MTIAGVRLVFDSNLANEKRMPCSYPQKGDASRTPSTLVKAFRLEVLDCDGNWQLAHAESNNFQRLVMVPLHARTKGLRLICSSTWGDKKARVFAFEPMEIFVNKIPVIEEGPSFSEVRALVNPEDLLPPESKISAANASSRHSA